MLSQLHPSPPQLMAQQQHKVGFVTSSFKNCCAHSKLTAHLLDLPIRRSTATTAPTASSPLDSWSVPESPRAMRMSGLGHDWVGRGARWRRPAIAVLVGHWHQVTQPGIRVTTTLLRERDSSSNCCSLPVRRLAID
jgi:hypothetical protein